MKQLLISFAGGLLLLCIWAVIIALTSTDFAHEGPNSPWASPLEAWGRFLFNIGWQGWLSSLKPIPATVLGVMMLLGPFVVALSAASYLTIWGLRRMVGPRPIRG
jgi:drug/metabolite transporter (DMT)-like permease